jgi:transposase
VHPKNNDTVEVMNMLALDPRVVGAVWSAIEPNLPVRPDDEHPLGCHRPRICDRVVLDGILFRLVTGCSWDVAGRLGKGGETTLRNRFNEWVGAGVFDALVVEALAGFDKIIGLDLSEVAVDGSIHKAPSGGEGTGKSPVDRGKVGWKWSIVTDTFGIPVGWVSAGANVNDAGLIGPTLDSAAAKGLLEDFGTLHLDRGYDNQYVRADCFERGLKDLVIAERKKKNRAKGTKKNTVPLALGLRWPVERTNSWLSNFGQLRRNTDRLVIQRMAQLALAIALILTVKLMKWADRWNG